MIDAMWFFGVVEDVYDPLQLGRVRVRPYNVYSSQQAEVSTEQLPWASVIQSTSRSATNNVGTNPVLSVGTTVFGIFADGEEAQTPMIMGRISGTNVNTDDPSFHDIPWLARPGVTIDTDEENDLKRNHFTSKTTNRDLKVPKKNWNEPADPYAAEYPYNKVERTTSGHIFEVDDTPGAERIHNFHKSGTFEEIHPNGTVVRRIVGENYEIVANDDNVHIKGVCNLTIDQDCNTYIKKNWNIDVDGNVNMNVKGNVTETVGGNVTEMFQGNQRTLVTGNIDIDAAKIDLN